MEKIIGLGNGASSCERAHFVRVGLVCLFNNHNAASYLTSSVRTTLKRNTFTWLLNLSTIFLLLPNTEARSTCMPRFAAALKHIHHTHSINTSSILFKI